MCGKFTAMVSWRQIYEYGAMFTDGSAKQRDGDGGEGSGNDPGAANRHGMLLERGARWLERRQRRILDVAR